MAVAPQTEVLMDDTLGVVAYNLTEAKLAELKQEFSKHTMESASSTQGFLELRRSIAVCRDLRGNIEDRRKQLKAPILEKGKEIDDIAKKLTKAVEEIEKPLKKISDDIENEKARLKAEKEAAERKRIEAELAAKRAEEERIKQEEAAKLKAEQERIAAEQKAEADRLAAEKAQLAEAQRKLAEERAALMAEQERIAVASQPVNIVSELDKDFTSDEMAEFTPIESVPDEPVAIKPALLADNDDPSTLLAFADEIESFSAFSMPRVSDMWSAEIVSKAICMLRDVSIYIRNELSSRQKATDPTLAAIAKSVKSEMDSDTESFI